ncbi:disulfide bond formation protein B [Parvibium lacunae]|uniref:disulfide bond formation protein B n=1 Tax=Parvibium lacunae TaxID=1888893 RepID=UPI001314A772|nr:disulfide bond formation protein B [Parvibium lacunae]
MTNTSLFCCIAAVFTARRLAALASFICVALLATGYALQYGWGLQPCPLCVVQRGVLYVLAISFAVTAYWANGQRRLGLVSIWLALVSLVGLGLASRHIWIQKHPELAIPSCFGSLGDMFAELPLLRFAQNLLNGTVECSKIDWTFVGLTIPQWTWLWFLLFTILAGCLPRLQALHRRSVD